MNKFPYYGIYHCSNGNFVIVKFIGSKQDSHPFVFGKMVCSTRKRPNITGFFSEPLYKPIDKKLLTYYKKQAIFYKL